MKKNNLLIKTAIAFIMLSLIFITGCGRTPQNQQNNTNQPQTPNEVIYKNTEYGFDFTLPQSWKGYTIVTSNWNGVPLGGTKSEEGPIISIRHPEWTSAKPRQDIPIMVFTLAQWDAMNNSKFSVGAAPIPPSELGRNSKYVFALPARYNYSYPEGFQEVETILNGKPLKPTENFE
ncbi:MAG: hypothetical protein GYA50_05500 [Eubacteriaceae bacterium]|nr:hypothetical protein [Eubacteriaceae bacterium]